MPAHILLIQAGEVPNQDLIQLLEAEKYQIRTTGMAQVERRLAMAPPDLAILRLCRLGSENRPLCRRICQQAKALMVPLVLLIDECDSDGLPQGPEACLISSSPPQHIATAIRMLLQHREARILAAGGLCLRLDTHRVHSGDRSHALPPKEFCLLETFMRHPTEVLSRRFLMREVWNTDFVGDTRTLEVHVHLVRKKIETDPHRPRYLRTVRGVGYRFAPT
jgi:DNA-binding response OmpR family regulator